MAKRNRTQVTVELAPKTKTTLEELARAGDILSVQDFIRRAVEHELDRERAKTPRLTEQERRTIRDARPP